MSVANGTEKAPEKKRPDAGMRSVNHYRHKLPAWRYELRELIIPFVRKETPYLAAIQSRLQTPALDTYFALTANLGTHTFFMILLPILFWCGYVEAARGLVHVLAAGVFFSGFLKDLCCIPRPLSPPLQRISRSLSAALEYGFPSTHSTNAVSVVVYTLYCLKTSTDPWTIRYAPLLQVLLYFYGISIIAGRIYCGMHGFLDVIVGVQLGAAIGAVQCIYGEAFDKWIYNGSIQNVLISGLIVLVLVRIHPEPADDCPCFDDSVAFSGVFIGIQIGTWAYAGHALSWNEPVPSTVPFSLAKLGLLKTVLRILLGVTVIFVWRGVMKPLCLRVLPPIFRVIDQLGLTLPRKFFLNASEYENVPPLRKDDNVIPPASEIPAALASLRNPRKRTISVGPQSEADAYEAMALRERRRQVSASKEGRRRSSVGETTATAISSVTVVVNGGAGDRVPSPEPEFERVPDRRAVSPARLMPDPDELEKFPDLEEEALESFPGSPAISRTVSRGNSRGNYMGGEDDDADDSAAEDARRTEAMFRRLLVPRVRYDVEVVTKLIVYSGIACLSAQWNPILFEYCGLGMGLLAQTAAGP